MYPKWFRVTILRFGVVKRSRCLVCQQIVINSNSKCIQFCATCCQLRPVKTTDECVDYSKRILKGDDKTFIKNKSFRIKNSSY